MVNIGEKCCGCGSCAAACPKGCITMKANERGFLYPEIEAANCVHCGKCEGVCPVLHAKHDSSEDTSFYSAINKQKEERIGSSSGAFFPALAEYVLGQGGVVCGAAFDEGAHHLRHICIEDKNDLKALRGSKYIQSDSGQAFDAVASFLKAGRQVLFTGTPCQAAALSSFLGKPYPNLITMDIICHGAASPLMWEKYASELESRYKSKIKEAAFRDKKYGWRTYSMRVAFQNGKTYRKIFKQDPFGRAYLSNIMLRPACYDCSFLGIERVSDFTVGDFWMNRRLMPDDDCGISLILIHSEKGNKIWSEISGKFESMKLSRDQAVKGNTPLYESAKCDLEMDRFYTCVQHISFHEAVKKYVHYRLTLKQRVLYLAKTIGLK